MTVRDGTGTGRGRDSGIRPVNCHVWLVSNAFPCSPCSASAFVDESGLPHPNDDTLCPVLAAICLSEKDTRAVIQHMYQIKMDIYERADIEVKAANMLRPKLSLLPNEIKPAWNALFRKLWAVFRRSGYSPGS